jgi:hypothetical protein
LGIIYAIKVQDINYDNTIELTNDMIYYACLLITDNKYKYIYRIKQIEWMAAMLIQKYSKDNTIKPSKIFGNKDLKIFFDLLDEFKRKDPDAIIFAKNALEINKTYAGNL